MIDLLSYALQVLGGAVALLAVAVAFVLIFWPDKSDKDTL